MDNNKLATKPHYPILDRLRGVAALIVVCFHLCEPLGTSHLTQIVNYGYLALRLVKRMMTGGISLLLVVFSYPSHLKIKQPLLTPLTVDNLCNAASIQRVAFLQNSMMQLG